MGAQPGGWPGQLVVRVAKRQEATEVRRAKPERCQSIGPPLAAAQPGQASCPGYPAKETPHPRPLSGSSASAASAHAAGADGCGERGDEKTGGSGSQACAALRPGLEDLSPLGLKTRSGCPAHAGGPDNSLKRVAMRQEASASPLAAAHQALASYHGHPVKAAPHPRPLSRTGRGVMRKREDLDPRPALRSDLG